MIKKLSNKEKEDFSEGKSKSSSGKDLIKKSDIPQEVIDYAEEHYGSSEFLLELSEKDIKKIHDGMKRFSMGVQAGVIQTCSTNCESYDKCPLVLMNKMPRGELCPIELNLYESRTREYREAVFQRIQNQDGIETIDDVTKDRITSTLIAELVEADIMELRANAMIADAGITEMVPALATEHGIEWRRDESVALRIKERFKKRRDMLLRQLLATPEMIQKTKQVRLETAGEDRVTRVRKKVNQIIETSGKVEEDEVLNDELSGKKKDDSVKDGDE